MTKRMIKRRRDDLTLHLTGLVFSAFHSIPVRKTNNRNRPGV